MDIVEIRRENLRRWLRGNATPANEKSLFSQLKSTGSFGEKVARRLERQYKMGDHYLDTAGIDALTPQEIELLRMFRVVDDEARSLVMTVVGKLSETAGRPPT